MKRRVRNRANNRCERCGVDFDEDFDGEFHHIIPAVFGGSNELDNCSLLCHSCHNIAPNLKSKSDMLIYKHYFLRFASFKEAAQYYGVDNRFGLSVKFAFELAQILGNEKKIKNIENSLSKHLKFIS
ncbi:MAG: HNH endonuclease signature motif containing protein [Thermoplasmatales archaeon]|nr:HNH endonuclease signature motif containing protein [Thermoplasmatales archaeon]